MNVLITGGSGFIGRHLHHELAEHGHWVTVVDRHLGDGHDILEPHLFDRWMTATKPDVVIHLAAQVGRLFGEDDVRNSVRSNAEMTATVAKVCSEHDTRLMYASTSEVYGDQGNGMCIEAGPMMLPHNIYGLSKRWGEEVCRLYLEPHQLTTMRFSMPYGPGSPPGRGRRAMDTMLWQAQHKMEITVHRGAERSWCWIGDTVAAVRMLMEGQHHGPFNVGRDDDPRSMLWLAQQACRLADAPKILITEVDPPERQTVVKRLYTRKIRDLGWRPTVEIDEGLERMAEWVANYDANGKWLPVEKAA